MVYPYPCAKMGYDHQCKLHLCKCIPRNLLRYPPRSVNASRSLAASYSGVRKAYSRRTTMTRIHSTTACNPSTAFGAPLYRLLEPSNALPMARLCPLAQKLARLSDSLRPGDRTHDSGLQLNRKSSIQSTKTRMKTREF